MKTINSQKTNQSLVIFKLEYLFATKSCVNEEVPKSEKCKEPRMAGDLLGKRCFSSQHVSHDLTEIQDLIAEKCVTETIFL